MRCAGVDVRDIDRLVDGSGASLVDEVIAAVRRSSSRRKAVPVILWDIVDDVAEFSGAAREEVEDAFSIAYRDNRVTIDKDGFVKLVNARKKKLSLMKQAPGWVKDEAKWEEAKDAAGDDDGSDEYWATVTKIYKEMGGEIDGKDGTRRDILASMASRMQAPPWVSDISLWKRSLLDVDPQDDLYWGKVVLAYRKAGGKINRTKGKTAEFNAWPFDATGGATWIVSNDNVLTREIRTLQAYIADGIEPEELVEDLVTVGVDRRGANAMVDEALRSPVLI